MVGVGESRLGRKRVALEPLEQMPAIRADHLDLRRVKVRVDEPGRDQAFGPEVDDLVAEVLRMILPGADRHDLPPVDRDEAILMIGIRMDRALEERVVKRGEDAGAIDDHRDDSIGIPGRRRPSESFRLRRAGRRRLASGVEIALDHT